MLRSLELLNCVLFCGRMHLTFVLMMARICEFPVKDARLIGYTFELKHFNYQIYFHCQCTFKEVICRVLNT